MMRFDLVAGDIAYVCLDPDRLREFLRVHRGRGFVLPWPRTHGVKIQTDADLGLAVGEVNRLSHDYLCCREDLVVLGGVYRVGGTEDFVAAIGPSSYRTERGLGVQRRDGNFSPGDVFDGGDEETRQTQAAQRHLAILLLGEYTRVYLYVGGADNAMYLLGHSYADFLKRGLRRYYPIYGEVDCCGDYGKGFVDRVGPGSADAVARFAISAPGTMFALPWPKGAFLKIVSPRERLIHGNERSWRLLYFASIVGPNLDPVFREILLALGANGVVYAYNPWEDSVVRVCGAVRELFSVGLRAVKKCYRYRHRLPFCLGDRIPPCPHTETFVPLPEGCFSSGSVVRGLCRMFDIYGTETLGVPGGGGIPNNSLFF